MCEICGCSDGAEAKVVNLETGETQDPASKHRHGDLHHPAHSHDHEHNHGHGHGHDHDHDNAHHGRASTVLLERDVLATNAALAASWPAACGGNAIAMSLMLRHAK